MNGMRSAKAPFSRTAQISFIIDFTRIIDFTGQPSAKIASHIHYWDPEFYPTKFAPLAQYSYLWFRRHSFCGDPLYKQQLINMQNTNFFFLNIVWAITHIKITIQVRRQPSAKIAEPYPYLAIPLCPAAYGNICDMRFLRAEKRKWGPHKMSDNAPLSRGTIQVERILWGYNAVCPQRFA